MAFSSAYIQTEGRREAPMAKFRIYVNSTTARQQVKPLNALVSEAMYDSSEPSDSSSIGDNYTDPDFELTSISMLDPGQKADVMRRSLLGSSFFGLVLGENKETTMVMQDGHSTSDSVTSASCEVLAQCLGWHVQRRTVSGIF